MITTEDIIDELLLENGISLISLRHVIEGVVYACQLGLNAEDIKRVRDLIDNRFNTYSIGVFSHYEGTKLIEE